MKKLLIVFCLVLLVTGIAHAQEDEGIRSFPISLQDGIVLPDGNILLIGQDRTTYTGDTTALAICISPAGDVLYEVAERFESVGSNVFLNMIPLGDGRVVLGNGHARSIGRDYEHFTVVTTMRDGEIEARLALPKELWYLHPARDGFFAYGADSTKKDRDGETINVPMINRYDSDGTLLFSQSYDAPFHISGIIPAADGYYAIGNIKKYNAQPSTWHGHVMMMDDKGHIIWEKSSPSGHIKTFMDAVVTPDGGVLAVGEDYRAVDAETGEMAAAARYRSDGTLMWDRTYDVGSIRFMSVLNTPEGFLIAGHDWSMQHYVQMVLLDDMGDIVRTWTEFIGENLYRPINVSLSAFGDAIYLIVGAETIPAGSLELSQLHGGFKRIELEDWE